MPYTQEINIIIICIIFTLFNLGIVGKTKILDTIIPGMFIAFVLMKICHLLLKIEEDLYMTEKNMAEMEKIIFEYENTCPVIN